MFGIIAHGEQTRVNHRVQRLYAPIQTLGETRHIADAGHRNARVGNRLHRSAGGKQGHAPIRQTTSQLCNAGLIRHAQNRTLNHLFLSFAHDKGWGMSGLPPESPPEGSSPSDSLLCFSAV